MANYDLRHSNLFPPFASFLLLCLWAKIYFIRNEARVRSSSGANRLIGNRESWVATSVGLENKLSHPFITLFNFTVILSTCLTNGHPRASPDGVATACLICNLCHLTMPTFPRPNQRGGLFVQQVVTLQMRLVPEGSQCGRPSAGAQLQGRS